jgi:hypothetical protein
VALNFDGDGQPFVVRLLSGLLLMLIGYPIGTILFWAIVTLISLRVL